MCVPLPLSLPIGRMYVFFANFGNRAASTQVEGGQGSWDEDASIERDEESDGGDSSARDTSDSVREKHDHESSGSG